MLNRFFFIFTGFIFFFCSFVCANNWEEFFRAIIDKNTGSKIIESDKLYQGSVYSANLQFIITDQDHNTNNFSGPDLIDLKILGKNLEFYGTKDQLIQWAETNGSKIYDAMFPGDVGSAVAGGTDAQYTQAVFFPSLILKNLRTENTNNFIARMEFAFAKVGENNEDLFSFIGVPSYGINFGEKLANSIGIMIPLRYAIQDDQMNSELFSFGLNPYLRYNVFEQTSALLEEDRLMIDVGLNPFMNVSFISCDILGGMGTMRFGGCLFTAADWTINENLKIRFGISYQVSKAYFPSGVLDGELKWIEDVINDLPFDHEISFGINVTVALTENFSVSLDYFRTHSLSSRVDSADVAVSNISVLFGYLLGDIIDLSLGYKTRLEIQDLTEHSLLVGGMIRF